MKDYIGSGKKHPSYDVIKVTICMDDAEKHIYKGDNGKRYLTFDVSAKREPDQYGKTHSVSVWVPENQNNSPVENQPDPVPDNFPDGF